MKKVGKNAFEDRRSRYPHEGPTVNVPRKETEGGQYRKLNPNRPRAGRDIVLTATAAKWKTKLLCKDHGIQSVIESDGFTVKLECGCTRDASSEDWKQKYLEIAPRFKHLKHKYGALRHEFNKLRQQLRKEAK